MKRRKFIATSALAATGSMFLPSFRLNESGRVPGYLKDYKSIYRENPREANLAWFKDAKFGMFIHYGLYSIPGGIWNGNKHQKKEKKNRPAEWIQFSEKIYVDDYAKLKDNFSAEKFDADFITDLAAEAGMKYINITSRHHDSFCLWDTKYSDFKSTNSPAKRDLIAELSEQCNKKDLALFLYYSHGRDWRHPHAPNNDKWKGAARPFYDPPEPTYKYGKEHDLENYLEFMNNQISELLTNYSPLAGIWLDGIGTPISGDYKLFRCQELYDMIHNGQPQVLVSYKTGLLDTEDFFAPERDYDKKTEKPLEICDTLQPHSWGYSIEDNGNHKTPAMVMDMLEKAASYPANLLLNTGPLPSGEIHPDDVKTLREVGRMGKKGR